MEEYKKSVNAQHASQELMERTLERIREEEKLSASDAGRNPHVMGIAAACLAACLTIIIVISGSQTRLTYNPVSDSMVRSGLPEESGEEWSIEEYEAYLGVNLSGLLMEYEWRNSRIYVSRDGENGNVRKDEGTFYLNADDSVVILKLSKSGLEIPEALRSGEPSDVNGVTVYVGEEVAGRQLLAVFYLEDVQYYFICNDMSKRQFERLLKDMIQEEV